MTLVAGHKLERCPVRPCDTEGLCESNDGKRNIVTQLARVFKHRHERFAFATRDERMCREGYQLSDERFRAGPSTLCPVKPGSQLCKFPQASGIARSDAESERARR